MPDCRRLALCRYRRTPRSDPRCFGGPGASAADRPEAEGEGGRSLNAREAKGQGCSGCSFDGGGSLERRRSRQSALRLVAAPLVVCSRPLVRGGSSSDFASTRAHGTDATPATAATGLRRPPHKQKHRSRLWRPVAAVAAFCVPTTPAAPTPPRLAGRSRQTAALAAAAF